MQRNAALATSAPFRAKLLSDDLEMGVPRAIETMTRKTNLINGLSIGGMNLRANSVAEQASRLPNM
jgi:hypothetical protein